jgi:hypothetical protein
VSQCIQSAGEPHSDPLQDVLDIIELAQPAGAIVFATSGQ